jgi:hypothetical protein
MPPPPIESSNVLICRLTDITFNYRNQRLYSSLQGKCLSADARMQTKNVNLSQAPPNNNVLEVSYRPNFPYYYKLFIAQWV